MKNKQINSLIAVFKKNIEMIFSLRYIQHFNNMLII